MIRTRIFFMIVLALSFLSASCYSSQNSWTEAMDKKGIKVYSRPLPGSELMEFKAIGVLDADMEVLRAVLRDIPSYPQWMSNCRETSILKKLDQDNYLIYYVQSLPWPIANRDVVLKASTTVRLDEGFVLVKLQSVNDSKVVMDENRVRMGDFAGDLLLEFIDAEHTRITFTIKADPAGSLPSKGVNAGTLNVPYRTLVGMKKMVKMKKYIKAAAAARRANAK